MRTKDLLKTAFLMAGGLRQRELNRVNALPRHQIHSTIQINSPTFLIDINNQTFLVNIPERSVEPFDGNTEDIPTVKLERVYKTRFLEDGGVKVFGFFRGRESTLTIDYKESSDATTDSATEIEPQKLEIDSPEVLPIGHYVDVAMASLTKRRNDTASANGYNFRNYGSGRSYSSSPLALAASTSSGRSNGLASVSALIQGPPDIKEKIAIFRFKNNTELNSNKIDSSTLTESILSRTDAEIVVLDFSFVTHVDHGMLSKLVSFDSDLERGGRFLVLVNVPSSVRKMLSGGIHRDLIISEKETTSDIKTAVDLRRIDRYRSFH